jgi:hypothetical protein
VWGICELRVHSDLSLFHSFRIYAEIKINLLVHFPPREMYLPDTLICLGTFMFVWELDLKLPMPSMSITTNPTQERCTSYNIM